MYLVQKLQSFTVSENKALCHPASVDSLSTSAGTEDHVSMGCFAARKAIQVSWPLESHFNIVNFAYFVYYRLVSMKN
jgi:histidine ammonia-lyase